MAQPDTKEQILRSHAELIHRIVMHCNNPGSVPDLEQVLQQAEGNDWQQLVAVIRDIMSGNREESIPPGLDDEDRIIIQSILLGLQDPNTLPQLPVEFDSPMAAPGIAGMVHAARNGNAQALQIVGAMPEQMLAAGGDTAILAGRIRLLVEGERDAKQLIKNMTEKDQKHMLEIIEELLKLEANQPAVK